MSGRDEIELDGVRLTHPDRVLFPAQGITKRELASYLVSVSEHMLPFVADRPLTLVRCPRGRERKCFYQRHHMQGMPKPMKPIPLAEKGRGKADYLYLSRRAGLLSAAQLGVLELHVWGSRIDAVEMPDRLVFDLDPDPTVTFAAVKQAAVHVRDVLDAAGMRSFALLTGGKGIHVIAPLARQQGWDDVKRFARGIARALAAESPRKYVAQASKAKRQGKVYIDWLRNERGATAIAPYSTRAHEGCPIAVPVSWRELSRARAANQYSRTSCLRRLRTLRADPWPDYFELRQSIPAGALEHFQ